MADSWLSGLRPRCLAEATESSRFMRCVDGVALPMPPAHCLQKPCEDLHKQPPEAQGESPRGEPHVEESVEDLQPVVAPDRRAEGGLLFNVVPYDPRFLLGTTAVLLLAAFAACLSPALRATRIDPVQSLRGE